VRQLRAGDQVIAISQPVYGTVYDGGGGLRVQWHDPPDGWCSDQAIYGDWCHPPNQQVQIIERPLDLWTPYKEEA
jgi:hypothetical protein